MYEEQVKQKVTLLCLMNLAAELPATERTISFAAITARTQLPTTEVEWLLMRAMSLGLVKGSIDEVDQVVEISYVKVGGLAECAPHVRSQVVTRCACTAACYGQGTDPPLEVQVGCMGRQGVGNTDASGEQHCGTHWLNASLSPGGCT